MANRSPQKRRKGSKEAFRLLLNNSKNMDRRYLSIALHLISAVHLSISVFSHYMNDIPANVFPIDSDFCGKFIFFTFWNECMEAGFFCLALIYDVLQIIYGVLQSRLDRDGRRFFNWIMVVPLVLMMVTALWGQFFVDRELVMPKDIDSYFPSWLNDSVHIMIGIYACSILEMFISYRLIPSLRKRIIDLTLLNGLYIIWIHVVYSGSGLWVYHISSKLALPYRTLLSNFVAGVILFFSGPYVSSFVWKKLKVVFSRLINRRIF